MKFFVTAFLFLSGTILLNAQSAIGTWITIDDESGAARSHIKIVEQDGKLYGTISKTLDDSPETHCKTCSGKHANAPYLGMEIISSAAPDGEKEWSGKIYDPETDGTYKLVMWIEDDADVLYVRGKHWTGLYRTQTWKRM